MAVETWAEGVRWRTALTVVVVQRSNVFSTLEDVRRKHLYVLHKDATGCEWLEGFSQFGTSLFKIQAPSGFNFGYLVHHAVHGSTVVMRAEEMMDAWYDWHFTISDRGELSRGPPAY